MLRLGERNQNSARHFFYVILEEVGTSPPTIEFQTKLVAKPETLSPGLGIRRITLGKNFQVLFTKALRGSGRVGSGKSDPTRPEP